MQVGLTPNSFVCPHFMQTDGNGERRLVVLAPSKLIEAEKTTIVRWGCSLGRECWNPVCSHAFKRMVEGKEVPVGTEKQ